MPVKDAYSSPHPQARIDAAGADIAYVDTGRADGPPVVFLHGNPTSSYLWRDVIPHVADTHRCLAPDLAGMGNSGPMPSGTGTLADHIAIIDAWFDALDLKDVTLVLHDWGSAIGFDWASRNQDRVAGIVYMEAVVGMWRWNGMPEAVTALFKRLRGPDGDAMVLDNNFFVEVILPRSIIRDLSGEEMAVYRAPFPDRETRQQTLTWPRQIPIEGEPADVVARVAAYTQAMRESPVPKLFINAEPGAITVGPLREACRSWANQREITVPGIHFIQEDSAAQIGAALQDFLG